MIAGTEESAIALLETFVRLYDEADVVTGHYIRKFDLLVMNGAMLERGMRPLGAKLTSDTHSDLYRKGGLSASQENLGQVLGLASDKYHMNDAKWREAARLTPDGLEETRRRVMDDVKQHKELRAELLRRSWLKDARWWRP